jgi:O-methyltransferase
MPYTMTTYPRMWALLQAVRYVHSNGIPGDFVECGVWRGGSSALMARTLDVLADSDRKVWLYDTFNGMTEPGALDVQSASGVSAATMMEMTEVGDGDNVWAYASLTEVLANLRELQIPSTRLQVVAGDVRLTLENHRPDAIAILRLDTDFYDSTTVELEHLYPRLSKGGVLIIDDYGHWSGARRAVDEFFQCQASRPLLIPIDETGRLCIKMS